jgi:hypothetical protein
MFGFFNYSLSVIKQRLLLFCYGIVMFSGIMQAAKADYRQVKLTVNRPTHFEGGLSDITVSPRRQVHTYKDKWL